ncbi:MarR family winged helix-turn-helix transcriptional regulator [Enterococcus sp. CSURQ0835]|uniref:MarR family winged helix-turn-helix transcriptional regulator n=1 Tax=Enterococcus sp. CSURQ0835 TaxID=2681394 RepID=UPI001359BA5D|nr:MarR family transcriptional regulator [Enterococcus sp. CSURQ0835]
MSKQTLELLKQLRLVTMASSIFLSKQKRLTGQARVLQVLNEEDGLIQSQLAEILDLRPSSLAELLKKMEANQTIIRREDQQDKRLKRVYLTKNGQQKIQQQLKGRGKDRSEDFFAGLSESELVVFSELLQKIPAAWDRKIQQQASRFIDPMDRLEQMKEFQQAWTEQFGTDWNELSRAEQRDLRRKMEREMNAWPENDACGFGFGGPFQRGFHGGPHGFHPFEKRPSEKETDQSHTEWEDF